MNKGIFITATDTGVGKTYVACAVARALKGAGISCGVFKPICSGGREDAREMIRAAGIREKLDVVNPVHFRFPLAPLMAGRREKKKISLEPAWDSYKALSLKYDFMVVEGAGGVMVPIHSNYFMREMMQDFGLPVVVVARPDLGTINHTLLSIAALRSADIEVLGIVISYVRKPSPDEKKTAGVIRELSRLPVAEILPKGALDWKDFIWMLGKKR